MATGSTGTNPQGTIDPSIVDTGSLNVERVTSMHNAIQGLHNVVQSGNMGPGVSEVIQQVIEITKHSVALHAKVEGSNRKVDGVIAQVQNMGSDIEAKLAIPVKDKIDELEQKGSHLTSEVAKAIELLKQQDN